MKKIFTMGIHYLMLLTHIEDSRRSKPGEAVRDRGYKGKSEVEDVPPLKKDNRYQRDKKRNKCNG